MPNSDIKPPPKWKIPSAEDQKPVEQLLPKLSNALLKIPLLEYGWRRELVCRTSISSDTSRPRLFDVYYYSPEGKKLRSHTQILEYLSQGSALSGEHFSFSKGLIGLGSDLEWVREAKSKEKMDCVKNRDSGLSFQSVPNKPTKKATVTPKAAVNPKGMVNPKKRRRSKASFYDEDDLDLGMAPPVATSRESLLVCSILCPAALGCIPTLQCTSCLCLYHPQCLNLDPENTYIKYVCTNCRKKKQAEEVEKKKLLAAAKPIPPLKPLPKQVITFTSKLVPSHMSAKIPPKPIAPKPINKPIAPNPNSKPPKVIVPRNKVKLPLANKPIAPKPLRPLAPVPNTFNNVVHKPMEEPMQSVIQLGNKKFIAIPRSTLGPAAETIQLGNKKFLAIPKSPLTPGGKSLTPTHISPPMRGENQLPAPKAGAYVINPPNSNVPGLLISVPTTPQYYVLNNGQMQTILPKPSSKELTSKDEARKSSTTSTTGTRSSELLSVGSEGLTVLIRVLKHLQLNDLLRAAQVNRLFYAASRHYTLWRTVHLKNVQVNDWNMFAR